MAAHHGFAKVRSAVLKIIITHIFNRLYFFSGDDRRQQPIRTADFIAVTTWHRERTNALC